MLAKHKSSVTQPHMVVFKLQFGTNLTQSIFRSVTFKIESKFNCMSWPVIIDTTMKNKGISWSNDFQ